MQVPESSHRSDTSTLPHTHLEGSAPEPVPVSIPPQELLDVKAVMQPPSTLPASQRMAWVAPPPFQALPVPRAASQACLPDGKPQQLAYLPKAAQGIMADTLAREERQRGRALRRLGHVQVFDNAYAADTHATEPVLERWVGKALSPVIRLRVKAMLCSCIHQQPPVYLALISQLQRRLENSHHVHGAKADLSMCSWRGRARSGEHGRCSAGRRAPRCCSLSRTLPAATSPLPARTARQVSLCSLQSAAIVA